MKKSIILSIAAAALVFAGCAKEESAPIAKKGTAFSVYATPDVKMSNDGLTSSWDNNDAIVLFHESQSATGTYVCDGKFSTQYADGLFTGELAGELEEGETYNWYAFYPYNSNIQSPGERTSGYLTVGSTKTGTQTQNGNDSMAHLAGNNYPVYGATSAAAGETPEMVMHRLVSVIALNITNGTQDPLTVADLTFTIAGQNIVGTYYIDITGDAPVYTSSGDNYVGSTAKLTVNNGEAIAAGSSAKFYFAIKPVSITQNNPIEVSVTDASGHIFVKKDIQVNATFAAGAIKTLNLTVDGFSTEKGMTADNPFTVAEALALFEGTLPTSDVFVKGKVSQIDEISAQYKNATYWISDDGTTTSGQLEIFRGKYLDGADFIASTDQLGVGDEVVVKGKLLLYNSTQEMGQGNEIVYLDRVPYFSLNPTALTIGSAGGTKTFTISCKDDQDWEITPQDDWVSCEPESGTGPATVTVTVAENTGEKERECDIDIDVAPGLDRTITLTQGGASSGGTEETIAGTFTSSDGKLSLTTTSGITIVQEKGTSSTAPNANYNTATSLRIYDGNTITFSGKTITKIVFTHTASYNGGANTSANVGTYTRGTTSSVWEGEASSVTITNTKAEGASNIQIRPTEIKVTYK